MRMRDWSADVCSSDLGCPCSARVAIGSAAPPPCECCHCPRSQSIAGTSDCAAAMRSCPNLHHIKRSPVALPNGAAPPLREHDKLPRIFHHINKYHHLKMVNQFTNDLWRRHRTDAQGSMMGRSEEHTSELQSLRRNSYAVYCLKKKKKKRNTHNQ